MREKPGRKWSATGACSYREMFDSDELCQISDPKFATGRTGAPNGSNKSKRWRKSVMIIHLILHYFPTTNIFFSFKSRRMLFELPHVCFQETRTDTLTVPCFQGEGLRISRAAFLAATNLTCNERAPLFDVDNSFRSSLEVLFPWFLGVFFSKQLYA